MQPGFTERPNFGLSVADLNGGSETETKIYPFSEPG